MALLDVEGRCVRDGLDFDDLLDAPAFVACGVLLSYMVDDAVVALGSNRAAARAEVIGTLNGDTPASVPGVHEPDPDTWGLEPEHQAGLMAATAFMGAGG